MADEFWDHAPMSDKTVAVEPKDEADLTLVPRLRFPEFRDAEGWAPEPMGEVYSFKGNNSLSRDKLNYVAGSVKNIHYGDIHTKFSTHFDITKELVPFINDSEEAIVRAENLCVEGDMIFADASEDLADIGKSIEIVRLNEERVVSGPRNIAYRGLSGCGGDFGQWNGSPSRTRWMCFRSPWQDRLGSHLRRFPVATQALWA